MVSKFISQRRQRDNSHTDVRAWREVGWIFRDGETLTIERCGQTTRVREGLIGPQ